MMIFPKLSLIAIFSSLALVVSAMAQTPKKKLDPSQLACGQKVLVEDQTCPTGQVLEIAGSCFDVTLEAGVRGKGIQYNCVKRK
jgi:hypothetical protein